MGESFVNVTEGSGKKLHTNLRTIGANDVHDEVVVSGLPYLATYSLNIGFISIATLNDHIVQLMAGSSLVVYVHEIMLTQDSVATTAAFAAFRLLRLTTAGTGGTAGTPTPHDSTDAASGATGMTLPTAKGTEGTVFDTQSRYVTQTPGAAAMAGNLTYYWAAPPGGLVKPIRIPAGTANGIALKSLRAVSGCTVNGHVTFSEANF